MLSAMPEPRDGSRGWVFARAAVKSIAPMIGCTPRTLHECVKRDHSERDGVTKDEWGRLKALEREVEELRRANEIPKVASAFFTQAELDRRFKS